MNTKPLRLCEKQNQRETKTARNKNVKKKQFK